jgi:NAD+ diphosphatase
MFSCVAGFVDAGETLFECVQREAAEEVSVEIIPDLGIRYLNSQFWPFPSGSLMMACMAFVSEDVVPQPCMEEVEAAR